MSKFESLKNLFNTAVVHTVDKLATPMNAVTNLATLAAGAILPAFASASVVSTMGAPNMAQITALATGATATAAMAWFGIKAIENQSTPGDYVHNAIEQYADDYAKNNNVNFHRSMF